MKQLLVFVGCMAMAFSSQAAVITHNGFSSDSNTQIVTGGGLEWLRWDLTAGMSIEQATADIADGTINNVNVGTGWRLASNAEMAVMLNTFGVGGMNWDTDETTRQEYSIPWTGDNSYTSANPELQIMQLFGHTASRPNWHDPYHYVAAMFGEDLNANQMYNSVTFRDAYWQVDEQRFPKTTGIAILDKDDSSSTRSAYYIGVAFVRAGQATEVPAPGSLLLMVLGFALMQRVTRAK